MSRKRFVAFFMALTMLFTLMAPAFTFAVGDGNEDPVDVNVSETAGEDGEQPPEGGSGENDANVGGDDDKGGDDDDKGDDDADKGDDDADKGDDDADKGDDDADKGDDAADKGDDDAKKGGEPTRGGTVEYYLVGDVNSWSINASYKLQQINNDEYRIKTTLANGSKFKIRRVLNNVEDYWYPDGDGSRDYIAGSDGPYGDVSVYFRPSGNPDGFLMLFMSHRTIV